MRPSLVRLIERYLEDRKARGSLPRTLEAYRGTFRNWLSFLEAQGIDRLEDVTRDVLTAYQEHLMRQTDPSGRSLGLGRHALMIGQMRMFFAHLLRMGYLLTSPAAHLELPRIPRRLPARILDVATMKRLLLAPDVRTPLGLRDRTILELFYSTGVRAGELAGLDVFDIQTAEGELSVRRGKGARSRRIPVGQAACRWVQRYLDGVRPGLVRQAAQTALFVTWRGRRMHRRDLAVLVRVAALRAGIQGRVSPHTIRHTFATHMLRGKASLRHLQEMLGHAKLVTTQVYTRVDITDLKGVHRRCHPRGRG